jgi:hypothetical protein
MPPCLPLPHCHTVPGVPCGAELEEAILRAALGLAAYRLTTDAGSGTWLTVLGRAVARGEAAPEALHPRVATVAVVLLRNEYITRGTPTVPDGVLVEIVDQDYLPLVRGRGQG